MKKLKRREFLRKGSLISGSALVFGCSSEQTGEAPAVHTEQTYRWNMVTTWPPHFPVMGEGADMLAQWLNQMSRGRLQIQVYGGGELVPPFETFEAVSQGTAEMGHGASYYWAGKVPAAQFFCTVPFGMNAQQMNAWMYSGGGHDLWREVYSDFNLVPFPAGNTGMQMGGWFNKEINAVSDLKGLKMRIPGLGGDVIRRAGGTPLSTPGGEIYTNLERGVIDATEWVGPYHDYLMGFHRIAKFYYYPGWHEPGPVLELTVNKAKWQSLPSDLQMMIEVAAHRANQWMLAEFESKNNVYLRKIVEEADVRVLKFPDQVLRTLRRYSDEVIDELTAADPLSKKVSASFEKFSREVAGWAEISEKVYYSLPEFS
ncbi:TRAP transporter substrate-binding protein [candidate division KSB1 bacterium]|nr:TRAP transporter substrate-binding protein [candidate division KSB1 bacterium]